MTDDWLSGEPMDPDAAQVEPLPPLPGFPFLHEGCCAVIVGPTGGGRSALAQAGLYDAALAGVPCAYLGSEVTRGEFNARAAVLAERRGDKVTADARRRMALVRYLELATVIGKAWDLMSQAKLNDTEFLDKLNTADKQTPAGQTPNQWADLVAARYAVVVIDPLSAAASALDLDFDKSNHEFTRFYDRLIQPLTARGITVVLIDNVGHAEDARTRAKGASAKSDRADLTFSCSHSTTPPGLIIKAGKVRSIRAGIQRGDEWLFLKDTQRIVSHGHHESDRPTFRPTTIMQRVSELLQQDTGLTRNAIRTTVGGRAEYVTLALELLVSEGYIAAEKDGQALRHRSVKPYNTDTESTESHPSPNQVPDPVLGTESTESHPLKGGTGDGPSHNRPSNKPTKSRTTQAATA